MKKLTNKKNLLKKSIKKTYKKNYKKSLKNLRGSGKIFGGTIKLPNFFRRNTPTPNFARQPTISYTNPMFQQPRSLIVSPQPNLNKFVQETPITHFNNPMFGFNPINNKRCYTDNSFSLKMSNDLTGNLMRYLNRDSLFYNTSHLKNMTFDDFLTTDEGKIFNRFLNYIKKLKKSSQEEQYMTIYPKNKNTKGEYMDIFPTSNKLEKLFKNNNYIELKGNNTPPLQPKSFKWNNINSPNTISNEIYEETIGHLRSGINNDLLTQLIIFLNDRLINKCNRVISLQILEDLWDELNFADSQDGLKKYQQYANKRYIYHILNFKVKSFLLRHGLTFDKIKAFDNKLERKHFNTKIHGY